MINKLPIIGWILSFVGNVSMSIPFWICWTVCGVGTKYFYWLPTVYQSIPFWDCVGVFMCVAILMGSLVPKFASVSQTNNSSKE